MDKKVIGQHMREVREFIELTPRELAAEADVSTNVVYTIENGKSYPNILSVINLLNAVNNHLVEPIGIDDYIGYKYEGGKNNG